MAEMRSHKRRKMNEEDYISGLPDDVLLQILLKLNPLEAARTCVLSTRWVHLWALNSTCLNIDADPDMFDSEKDNRISTRRFINTANKILSNHRAQTINQLSISYPLCASDTVRDHEEVNAWIKTAAKKQVKSLQLHYKPYRRYNHHALFSLGSTAFSSLITLSLSMASLTSQLIESFLCNSPNLEVLSIRETCGSMNHLKIESLKLNRLVLVANDIWSLQLSAPKLESFDLRSHPSGTRISFESTPLLTRLSYNEWDSHYTLCDYCTVLPQLETLSLTLSSYYFFAVEIPRFPSPKNLKQMHVSFCVDPKVGIPVFFGLFKAAHSLFSLSLELKMMIPPQLVLEHAGECLDHKFVKEVRIDGFNGLKGDQELLICIAKSCSSLQRIRLHPNPSRGVTPFFDLEGLKRVALEMASKLPQKELEILWEPKDPQTWKDEGLQHFQVHYCK